MRLRPLLVAVVAAFISGCYHITVVTGAPPSPTVIDKPWQMSFVYGLAPPPEINVRDQCPNGVAKVETQQSFLNGLVSALSSGIVTPIQATITCASR
jgi:Bor protein